MTELHSPRADSVGTGAPAEKIEITPAMLTAGAEELMCGISGIETTSDEDVFEKVCTEIYLAMVVAAPKRSPAVERVRPLDTIAAEHSYEWLARKKAFGRLAERRLCEFERRLARRRALWSFLGWLSALALSPFQKAFRFLFNGAWFR